jgi:hypothetical protein
MDFDDMPDSYFAFLSNQRKLAEPERVNGAMRDLGRGSEPEPPKNKVRSRASQPNLSSGSKPSVPSLPSIQRASAGHPHPSPMAIQPTGGRGFQPPSRPQLGAQPPTGPTSRPMMGPNVAHPMAPGGMPQMNQGMPGPMNRVSPMHQGHMQGHPGHMNQGHMNQMGHMAHSPNLHPSAGHGFAGYGAQSMSAPLTAPSRSNTLVFILIAVLIAAIAVLAYLVLTK